MHAPLISHYDPDVAGAQTMLALADSVEDARAFIQSPPAPGMPTPAKQIIAGMHHHAPTTIANLALARFRDTGEEAITTIPVLEALGFTQADLAPHMQEARTLYARALEESQKVLDRVNASPHEGPSAPQAAAQACSANQQVLAHGRAL